MTAPLATPVVAVLATLDTKAGEADAVREALARRGVRALLIDVGLRGTPHLTADIPRQHLATRTPPHQGQTGAAVHATGQAAATLLADLHARGEIDGAIGLGGGKGSHICAAALRALPFGVPKVLVSTLAGRAGEQLLGTSDLLLMPAVADLHGLNRITRSVLARAAAALVGMLAEPLPVTGGVPVVAVTALGVTSPAVDHCLPGLRELGFEPVVFHCTGIGGQAMEDLIRAGQVRAVVDLTLSELADELFGGMSSAGPARLEAAGQLGIPQVVAPGGLDMLKFRGRHHIPAPLRDRPRYDHTPTTVLVRTTAEENHRAGQEVARKLAEATGPCALVIPRGGFSDYDRPGGPFYDPACIAAFERGARETTPPTARIRSVDAHINDPAFAHVLLATLTDLLLEGQP